MKLKSKNKPTVVLGNGNVGITVYIQNGCGQLALSKLDKTYKVGEFMDYVGIDFSEKLETQDNFLAGIQFNTIESVDNLIDSLNDLKEFMVQLKGLTRSINDNCELHGLTGGNP